MIECSELTKVYGEGTASYQALRGLSFAIKVGAVSVVPSKLATTGPLGLVKHPVKKTMVRIKSMLNFFITR